MGTLVTITIRKGERKVDAAIRAAFAAIESVDAALSTYDRESELSFLNRHGYLDNPSDMVVENIRASLSYSRLTGGAFDITILPILRLYESSFAEGREPTVAEIEEALDLVDYTSVRILGDRIEIGEGQQITLGGFAKGYGVDMAIAALESAGIENAIVEAGGDLRVLGSRSDAESWRIAIRNPRDSSEFLTRLAVPNRAVVTSGDYERYYDAQREYHHIIDPTTGRSAAELISVTLIAETAFEADALSTAVFVLGPIDGLAFVEALDGVEALFITRSRRLIRSSGFERYELESQLVR